MNLRQRPRRLRCPLLPHQEEERFPSTASAGVMDGQVEPYVRAGRHARLMVRGTPSACKGKVKAVR
jgi:hypothetical protein